MSLGMHTLQRTPLWALGASTARESFCAHSKCVLALRTPWVHTCAATSYCERCESLRCDRMPPPFKSRAATAGHILPETCRYRPLSDMTRADVTTEGPIQSRADFRPAVRMPILPLRGPQSLADGLEPACAQVTASAPARSVMSSERSRLWEPG